MINSFRNCYKTFNLDKLQLLLFGLYLLSIYIFENNGFALKVSSILLLLFGIIEMFNMIKLRRIKFNICIIFIIIFALICGLSIFWALDSNLALSKAKTIFSLTIFTIFLFNYFYRTKYGLEKILKTIAIVGVAFSIFVILYYNPIDYVERIITGERVGFEIANVNSIGMEVIISFIICCFYAILKNEKKYYLLSLFPAIVAIGSGSRKSILFALLSLAFIIIFFIKKRVNEKKRNIIIFSSIILLAFVCLLYFLEVPFVKFQIERMFGMVNGILGIGDADHSTMLRVSYIKAGLEQFVKTPILGIGIDNARLINLNPTYLHNNFVELLASVGVIGFLSYYMVHIIIIYYFVKKRKKFNDYYLICLCVFAGLLMLDYGIVSYYSKTMYVYFIIYFLTLNVKTYDLKMEWISKMISKVLLKMMDAGMFNKMSDEKYIKLRYSLTFGKELDLDNPKTFNEKLQWLKLNDYNEIQSIMADKSTVKEYVSNIIGSKYIIPTLGVYDSFDEIDFSKLPNSFVIKCTHDSGGLVVVKNKKDFDKKRARKKINRSLKRNYFYLGRETPYKYIKPRIIIEKYINNNNVDLRDYKFFCFSGKVGLFLICSDRSTGVKFTFFDKNGTFLNITQCGAPNDKTVKLPKKFKEMKKLAEILAKDMVHVRVDFYEIDDKIYFGELTFFDSSGFGEFTPNKWDKRLGEMMVLPK